MIIILSFLNITLIKRYIVAFCENLYHPFCARVGAYICVNIYIYIALENKQNFFQNLILNYCRRSLRVFE